jgi:solute carrier family 25 folate transporter 32
MNQERLQIPEANYDHLELVIEQPKLFIKKSDPTSTARFFASLGATVAAVTVSSPLDVMKTRFQIQHQRGEVLYPSLKAGISNIWKQEGVKGFFRGYKATLTTTPLFHSIYFPCYEKLKIEIAQNSNKSKTDFSVVCASSAMTGILCNIITNPLWLVRTRMQAEVFRKSSQSNYAKKYKSVFGSINRIYKREGFLSLYTGLGASLLGISHV